MNIIFKLTLQYMKKNRRRTTVAIIGIVSMMVALTAVSVFANAFLGVIRSRIVEEEGAYHLIFHELGEAQCEELKASGKVKNCVTDVPCPEHEGNGTICVQVEMKKVSRGMLNTTQRMAKKLGMTELAEDERWEMSNRRIAKYNVTEHTELLKYYGVNHPNEGIGTGVMVNITLVLLALIGSVFIYNAYAISVYEKLKFLGTLGSVGASKLQRSLVVYWEGLLEGCVGIPVGIGLGAVISKIVLLILSRYFMFDAELSADISLLMIVKLIFAGILMILLACYMPAVTAVNTTGMELIARQHTMSEGVRRRTDLLKRHKILGLSGALAIKNIWAKRKNYWFNGMLLVLTFCLLLDGLAAMRGFKGAYDLKDERERPKLQLWVEFYTEDAEKIHSFFEQVSELEEVKMISLERILEMQGVFLEREQIQDDLDDYKILSSHYGYEKALQKVEDVSSGKEISGYFIQSKVIGLDEKTFREYADQSGDSILENEKYPVLIEDYVRVHEDGEKPAQRSILNVQEKAAFPFLFSRYGDIDSFLLRKGKVDEMREGEFYAIGTTEQAPPYPYCSGDVQDIDGHQTLELGVHRFYMSMDNFEKLLEDPVYKDTYGDHPTDSVADYTYIRKTIPAYMKFDIHRQGDNSIKEDKDMKKRIEAIAAEVGLGKEEYSFDSAAVWEREKYFNSKEFLQVVLGYGIILLIVAISFTNIFQNIAMSMRMRKREFSMYRSMGMTEDVLKKMLVIENVMYGVIGCLAGIPISFLFLRDVYLEFRKYHEIHWIMPWDLIIVEAILAVLLMVVPMIHTKSQIRQLNITDAIRDENV